MSDKVALLHLDDYALPAFVTVAAMVQQVRFAKRVGLARKKYYVPVPETTGDPAFVRTFRAQQNSVEFFPIAVSSLWISSLYFDPIPASIIGTIYLLGRQRYFEGYIESTERRVPGFWVCKHALFALLIMSGVGVVVALLRRYKNVDLAAIAGDLAKKVLNKH